MVLIFKNKLESEVTCKLESLIHILNTVYEHEGGIILAKEVFAVAKSLSLL